MIDGGATSPMLKLPKLLLFNKIVRVDENGPGSLSSFMNAINTDWSITYVMDSKWYIKTEKQLEVMYRRFSNVSYNTQSTEVKNC